MDLIDRLSGESNAESVPEVDRRPRISVHTFTAALRLYSEPTSLYTRAQIVTALDLQDDELIDSGLIADAVDAVAGGLDTVRYVLKVEAVCMLVEDRRDRAYHDANGIIDDKPRIRSDWGI